MTIALRSIEAVLASSHAVTLLVDEDYRELITLCFPDHADVLFYPRRALSNAGALARLSQYVGFMRQLRSNRYDVLLDMDGTVVSARLTRVARATRKIGPSFAKRLAIYSEVLTVRREIQHCFDDYEQLVNQIDVKIESDCYFQIPAAPDTGVAAKLGVDASAKLVCIHPSATKDYKQWSQAGFCELSQQLLADGWQVVIVGAGEGEKARVEAIMSATSGAAINAHNQLTLLELVELLQQASLFIGNDSGPMHYASAGGVYVCAIFGPTELVRWQPKVETASIIRGLKPCDPTCQPEDCKLSYQCMSSLPVDHVMESISKLKLPSHA